MTPRAIVTGSNTGIGFHIARRLSQQDFDVTLAVRNIDKGQAAAAELRALTGRTFDVEHLDLSDLNSVREFCENQLSKQPWSLLVNNAGAKIESPKKNTTQGFEWHYGVNVIGHIALTCQLLKNSTANSRVVSVTSIMARYGQLSARADWSASTAYADSKLANLVFAMKLAQKFAGTNRTSLAAAPGFARAAPYGPLLTRVSERLLAQSADSGSLPIVAASTNPTQNGQYFAPRVFELWGKPAVAIIPKQLQQQNEISLAWSRWLADANVEF